MYAGGMKKAEIARELGVSRPCIQNWARNDKWEERLYRVATQAEAALDFTLGNQVADVLNEMRAKMRKRVSELELLCSPANHPSTRLRAIQTWLKLAGIDRALPDPTAPTAPVNLKLIDDAIEEEDEE